MCWLAALSQLVVSIEIKYPKLILYRKQMSLSFWHTIWSFIFSVNDQKQLKPANTSQPMLKNESESEKTKEADHSFQQSLKATASDNGWK